MTIVKCVYSGKEQDDHKGVYLMKNDGTANYYASSKCVRGHLRLKRDKRKVRWTEAFHETRKKRQEKKAALAEKLKEEKKRREERKAQAKKAETKTAKKPAAKKK